MLILKLCLKLGTDQNYMESKDIVVPVKGANTKKRSNKPQEEGKSKRNSDKRPSSAKERQTKFPFAKPIYEAFKSCQFCMQAFFRFPLQGKVNPDGTYLIYSGSCSLFTIGFLITSFIIWVITLLVCLNTIGTIIDCPVNQKATYSGNKKPAIPISISWGDHRFEEKYIFRRNMVPIIILITVLIHASVGSLQLFAKREFAASYFTFWMEAAEIFKINAGLGLKREMLMLMGTFAIFLLILVLLGFSKFGPVSTGGPAVLVMLTLRCFHPSIHSIEQFGILRGFGGILFLYIIVCSKALMFFFIFTCKLIRNAFVVWNHRLDRVFHRGEDHTSHASRARNRIGFEYLFKDHVCLVDLMEGADKLFSNTIESYYATQIISLIFELYYFLRTQGADNEFRESRTLDALVIGVYLVQTMTVLFIVSMSAAEVGEEATDGMEILRRKGMMGKKTNEELYFILSLHASYNSHFPCSLTGGRFFVLDKGFIVAVLGTVFSYFVILMQFSPALGVQAATNQIAKTYDTARLLKEVEDTGEYFGLQVGYQQMREIIADIPIFNLTIV